MLKSVNESIQLEGPLKITGTIVKVVCISTGPQGEGVPLMAVYSEGAKKTQIGECPRT